MTYPLNKSQLKKWDWRKKFNEGVNIMRNIGDNRDTKHQGTLLGLI